MKIANREFRKPYEIVQVIPREDGPVVFKARAVLDFSNFDKLCPLPSPPFIRRPGEPTAQNVEDPKYKQKLIAWSQKRSAWLVLESLKATVDLIWEKVKADDSETWALWSKELEDGFFTQNEINLIYRAVARANSLDENHLEQARKDFLAMAALQNELSSQKAEPTNTPSGEPVKDSK